MAETFNRRRLDGKVAVITGAGGSIGRASSVRLAQEGAYVAVVDLKEDAATRTATDILAEGGRARAYACDVSDELQVNSLVERITVEMGPVELLHNNAGVLIPGSVTSISMSDWDLTYAVNVRGLLLMTRAVVPGMKAVGAGVVVNTASTAGLVGEPNCVAYDSSKGAVVNLTRQLAVDLAPYGIRVNCVCPGWIDTGFNDVIFEAAGMSATDIERLVENSVPMRRQGIAEDVAPAVAFLMSDDASYITGHPLVIDGGMVAQ